MTKQLTLFCLGWMLMGAYFGECLWWFQIDKAPNDWSVYLLYGFAGLGLSLIIAFRPREKKHD
jgi:hypothetical protein